MKKAVFPPHINKPSWTAIEATRNVFFTYKGSLFKRMMDDYEDLEITNKEPLNAYLMHKIKVLEGDSEEITLESKHKTRKKEIIERTKTIEKEI